MERYGAIESVLRAEIVELEQALADAQATVEALQRERDFFETAAATANRMRVDTERALDAERAKVRDGETAYKKLSEQWNAVDLELRKGATASETHTTYGIGPDKQFGEPQALRDERDRLRRALEEIAMGTIAWERDEMIDCALAALTPAGEGEGATK